MYLSFGEMNILYSQRLTKNILILYFHFALLILSPILVLVSLLIYLSGTKKIILSKLDMD